MKKITLTRGMEAIVDDSDFEEVMKHRWVFLKNRISGYAAYHIWENKKVRWVFLHNFLMKPPEGMVVDHINRDKLDNRRSNLRICTPLENAQNRPTRIDNKSGHRGIYFRIDMQKWCVTIYQMKKKIYCGGFPTKEEAMEYLNKIYAKAL